jgi:hypothetical protein
MQRRIMTPSALARAVLPGIIVACGIWVIGLLAGRPLGPAWTGTIQSSSFFIGLIWIFIGIRLRARAEDRSAQNHAVQ